MGEAPALYAAAANAINATLYAPGRFSMTNC
jgi:hypothetical protein